MEEFFKKIPAWLAIVLIFVFIILLFITYVFDVTFIIADQKYGVISNAPCKEDNTSVFIIFGYVGYIFMSIFIYFSIKWLRSKEGKKWLEEDD